MTFINDFLEFFLYSFAFTSTTEITKGANEDYENCGLAIINFGELSTPPTFEEKVKGKNVFVQVQNFPYKLNLMTSGIEGDFKIDKKLYL